jgi:uncharacterized protein
MPDELQAGIIFFNAGRYFDAHEAWEEMWRRTRGPLRLYYQGLVQAAVGMHHLGRGNRNGGQAQLAKALAKLEQYPDRFCGLENGKLVLDLKRTLQDLTPQQFTIERIGTHRELC